MNGNDRLYEQLKELTSLNGVSGQEEEVVKYLKDKFSQVSDEVFIDAYGNLSALKKGGKAGPNLMISAHSDEVGGVVSAVTAKGYLRFRPVGVVDPRIFPGIRLKIGNKVFGCTVCIPGHASSKNASAAEFPGELLIDIGANSEGEANDWGIFPGADVSYVSPLVRMNSVNLVMGKAIDNRVGCLILLQLFEKLQGVEFEGNLYGVVTVQEEIGMMGAKMITHRINPDYAIVLDTVPLDDTPINSLPDVPIRIGNGPVIQLRTGKNDVFLSTVAHKGVTQLIIRSADEVKVNIQRVAAYGKWVTDAEAIHVSGNGIPTGFLSIARRYGHTPNEIIDLNDAKDAIAVISRLVINNTGTFNSDFI